MPTKDELAAELQAARQRIQELEATATQWVVRLVRLSQSHPDGSRHSSAANRLPAMQAGI
jgi:hypothetical protein